MDKINKFFNIDKTIFNDENSSKNNEIFRLQYEHGEDLSNSPGIITDVENIKIKHSAITEEGSSGSPLIKRYNNNLVIGIHLAMKTAKRMKI